MNVIDEQEYLRRWLQTVESPNGARRLALNAIIGDFIGNAALAERVTRKIARDIVRQSNLTYKYKGEKTRFKDAPLEYFEDSTQLVGEPYQSPRIGYASLLEGARKTLRQTNPDSQSSSEARIYLMTRLSDSDKVRQKRNMLAHASVLWFTGQGKAIVHDRRLSHKMSRNGQETTQGEPTIDFGELLQMTVLADMLGNVGAQEAIWQLWPFTRPPGFVASEPEFVWPPEGSYAGVELNQEAHS